MRAAGGRMISPLAAVGDKEGLRSCLTSKSSKLLPFRRLRRETAGESLEMGRGAERAKELKGEKSSN